MQSIFRAKAPSHGRGVREEKLHTALILFNSFDDKKGLLFSIRLVEILELKGELRLEHCCITELFIPEFWLIHYNETVILEQASHFHPDYIFMLF